MQLQIDKLGKVSITVEQNYWDINKDYDKLTVVEKEGVFGTYISRKPVPAGVVLTNRQYWIPFSSLKEEIIINYNAFLDTYGEQLATAQDDIKTLIDEVAVLSSLKASINTLISQSETVIQSSTNTLERANTILNTINGYIKDYSLDTIRRDVDSLTTTLNTLISNPDATINSFNEIVEFLSKIENTSTLDGIINGINKAIKDGDKLEARNRHEDVTNIMNLICELHANINITVSPNVIEKGVATDVTISHNVTFNNKPLSYTLLVHGEELANPYNISDTTRFGCLVRVHNDDPIIITDIKKPITVNAYYPKYVGGAKDEDAPIGELMAMLTKQPISSSAYGTYNVTSLDDQYIWFCIPDTMTINKVTLNGFTVSMEEPIIKEVGSGENIHNYNCYRTTNRLSAGTRNFVVS